MKDIPVHQLQDRVDTGFQIKHYNPNTESGDAKKLNAHRDDHYLFLMVCEGCDALMVNFNSIIIKERNLYYVLPGQVHHRIKANEIDGW